MLGNIQNYNQGFHNLIAQLQVKQGKGKKRNALMNTLLNEIALTIR